MIRDSLRDILTKIDFDTDKTTLKITDPRDESSSVSIPYPTNGSIESPDELIREFQRIVYKHYNYDKAHKDDKDVDKGEMWIPDFAEQEIQRDLFWTLESVESDNTIVARKNSERVRIPDGSYYKIGKVNKDDTIHIITSRYVFQSGDKTDVNFINIYGRYILKDEEGEDTIRFYFNLKPKEKAISEWRRILVHRLNDRAIPFNLKYIRQLESYDRADAGVLYLQKNNLNLAAPIIRQAYNKLLKHDAIRKKVPLCTLELLPGFGFAESPIKRGVSFGINISKKISDGLFKYLAENKNLTSIDFDKAIDYIEKQFPLKFDSSYLNDDSIRTYEFELFKESSRYQHFPKTQVFLRAASHFANILKEKAIWINNQRTWITYTEMIVQKSMSSKKRVGFRLVNQSEREGIEFFLQNFESIIKNNSIVLDQISNQSTEPKIKYGKASAFETIVNIDKGKETEKENLKYAKNFIDKFINIRFAIDNAYGNSEFCPTISHGLAFFGYFFLYIHCQVTKTNKRVPALKDFLNLE